MAVFTTAGLYALKRQEDKGEIERSSTFWPLQCIALKLSVTSPTTEPCSVLSQRRIWSKHRLTAPFLMQILFLQQQCHSLQNISVGSVQLESSLQSVRAQQEICSICT